MTKCRAGFATAYISHHGLKTEALPHSGEREAPSFKPTELI